MTPWRIAFGSAFPSIGDGYGLSSMIGRPRLQSAYHATSLFLEMMEEDRRPRAFVPRLSVVEPPEAAAAATTLDLWSDDPAALDGVRLSPRATETDLRPSCVRAFRAWRLERLYSTRLSAHLAAKGIRTPEAARMVLTINFDALLEAAVEGANGPWTTFFSRGLSAKALLRTIRDHGERSLALATTFVLGLFDGRAAETMERLRAFVAALRLRVRLPRESVPPEEGPSRAVRAGIGKAKIRAVAA